MNKAVTVQMFQNPAYDMKAIAQLEDINCEASVQAKYSKQWATGKLLRPFPNSLYTLKYVDRLKKERLVGGIHSELLQLRWVDT